MGFLVPVSDEELMHVDRMLKDVGIAIAMSMSYIRKAQHWQFYQLSDRCVGVSEIMWKRYMQPSYTKMRPLHIVAAYSWLTMVPMPSFYRGLTIKDGYKGMDDSAIAAMIHCGILPKVQYQLVLDHIFEYLNDTAKRRIVALQKKLYRQYSSLNEYDDIEFMFPGVLDIESFQYDYYRSVALAFYNFRQANKLSKVQIAKVLGMSQHRYEQCENLENPVPLSADIVARLQLGFKLKEVVPFTEGMTFFPQFHIMRKVQYVRETILIEMMRYVSPRHRTHFVNIIKSMSLIYTCTS